LAPLLLLQRCRCDAAAFALIDPIVAAVLLFRLQPQQAW